MRKIEDLHGQQLLDEINRSRYDPHSEAGFYESYFLRANHPSRALAFWIRYTIFSPRGRMDSSEGQLWGIYFDGENSTIIACKHAVPISQCSFSNSSLAVRIEDSSLDGSTLHGAISQGAHRFSWDLEYQGDQDPAFLLPLSFYDGGFPKAKALTGIPLADFSGHLKVDGREIDVARWRGSQNHNWGIKHTDQYAWGQVAGFDNDPNAFLECSTVRLKIGPLWTPWLTNVVFRVHEQEIKLNSLAQAMRNRGRYDYVSWEIEAHKAPFHVKISIEAPKKGFAGLLYDDPPGGRKTCLNTKLASCTVQLKVDGKPPATLQTASRAAFEILAMAGDHEVPILA